MAHPQEQLQNATTGAISRRRALLSRLARPAGDAPLDVFCSGVGGTGLSGLARLAAALGHRVRGSDQAPSALSQGLEQEGMAVTYGQRAENLAGDVDLFVATAALPPNHPELVTAISRGIPVVKYAEALGAFVAARRGVAISGTHGKTTTTSLTAFALARCGRDPSWIIGGAPKDLEANSRLGQGQELVLEACEYDRSFRHYVPACAVVLNVEEDHLDCYDGLDEIVQAFVDFGASIKEGGSLIVSADWPAALRVADLVRAARPDVSIATFSLERDARYRARDIRFEGGNARFELVVDGAPVTTVALSIPGRHNVANALAAIAAAHGVGVDAVEAARAVEQFHGVARRFDVLGEPRGITVVDDYAHHPTAVEAVVAAARSRYPDRRIVAFFEPHQASRTRQHFEAFARALAGADRVVVGEIYACRDTPEDVKSVSAAGLARRVRELAPDTSALDGGPPDQLRELALGLLRPGDVALFMGAGRISKVAHDVVHALGEGPGPAPISPRRFRVLRGGGSGASGARARIASPLTVSGRVARPAAARPPRTALDEQVARELGDLVQHDAALGPHCTFKTGGRARFFVAPVNEAEAVQALRALWRLGVPVVPLGGGSNTLFAGPRVDAAVLHARGLDQTEVLGDVIRCGAGAALPGLIRLGERHGLAGLEGFAGIPGTIGGAVAGNAGGPPSTPAVGDLVARVRLLEPDGHVGWHDRERLALRYRHCDLRGAVILQVELQLRQDDPDRLKVVRQTASRKKASTQPLDARSAGCFFRNPPGGSAGRLIDELGLKGLRRGGASVSTVHANFLVNDGDATPDDVIDLATEIRRRVHQAKGIELEPEVRLVA